MKEIWVDVKGFERCYQVSNQGRIKSLGRVVPHKTNGFQKIHEKILKTSVDSRGYNTVHLYLNGKGKTFKPYKLVAIAFLDHKPGEDGLIVDHIERPRTDDRLSNLQLTTTRENTSKDRWRGNYSSKYVGVHWHNQSQKWRAKIHIKGKEKHLGNFNTEIEAHEAYQKALKNL